ncbi:phosphoheptose isomerase [Desulfuromonas versatilis]|uniref:Phosphoheptose isomerase n=1 Tax=Desulfuromonas versatilis TaxID=2802975 RepID=A0ABM8HXD9_9BACT|nr:D-sedoheptulose 7-phosphate isomerase [Desulfuromonas versatilis]BCR05191.1 phosphoheptose isomerase [Desulfuromonas versatilis]
MNVEYIKGQFARNIETMEMVADRLSGTVLECARLIGQALAKGNKVLIMGNGGSAADSQHFAAELVGRFAMERKGLPAIALTTDTSILTAVGNDYGYEAIFTRQVEALACSGDVVIGLSTSGNSPNVHQALERARGIGCHTIGLLGRDGGTIKQLADLCLTIPVKETPRIQEAHIVILHIVCDLVEQILFKLGED